MAVIRLDSSHDARPEEMVQQSQPSSNGFESQDLTNQTPIFQLPNEIWLSVLSTPCTFNSTHFLPVVENTIKNPNITSSCIFRADIFYDSLNDVKISTDPQAEHFSEFTKHMRAEYRPLRVDLPGFVHQRTIVRNMVPRNPVLDKALVQTCHIYRAKNGEEEKQVFLMIPHVSAPGEMPFYHPNVQALALVHVWDSSKGAGELSIHYRLFPEVQLDNRLQRTALNLLRTVHRHGVGQQSGYTKRVHHDLIVPQSKFQDTYTRLKLKYAKVLIGDWVEQTDPTKHVFEDLGIAAFLIELWEQMYGIVAISSRTSNAEINEEKEKKRVFPGFVDIGCGNGVLVNVLIQEGYPGWGFDARKRKTWSTFSPRIQQNLQESILVPQILEEAIGEAMDGAIGMSTSTTDFHPGTFPKGTFIISNHADELTVWTPLLAYLNKSSFIAIPCCSHNLAGTRTRFNDRPVPSSQTMSPNLPSTSVPGTANTPLQPPILGPGPSSGSLARTVPPKTNGKGGPSPPSAYQGLTAYVTRLASELGYQVEKEMLRIPSTRNAAVVGRGEVAEREGEVDEAKRNKVREIVQREVGDLEQVGKDWMERAKVIAGNKGGGSCH